LTEKKKNCGPPTLINITYHKHCTTCPDDKVSIEGSIILSFSKLLTDVIRW